MSTIEIRSSEMRYPEWRHQLTEQLLQMAVAAPAGSGARLFLLKTLAEISPWEDSLHVEEFKSAERWERTPDPSYWQSYVALDPEPLRALYEAHKFQLIDVDASAVTRFQQAIRMTEEAWAITRSVSQPPLGPSQAPCPAAPSPHGSDQS